MSVCGTEGNRVVADIAPKNINKMNKLKVVKVDSDAIEFENEVKLYSNHESDCCESHSLTLDDLTIADLKD